MEFIGAIIEFLKSLSPVLLIIIGGVLFVFSDAVKWLAKLVGVVMVIWGVATLLGFVFPAPVENVENIVDNLLVFAF